MIAGGMFLLLAKRGNEQFDGIRRVEGRLTGACFVAIS